MTVIVAESDTKAKPQVSTRGIVNYAERSSDGSVLYTAVQEHEDGRRSRTTNIKNDQREVEVHDLRQAGREFTLERNGFCLGKLKVPDTVDWDQETEVQEKVYPAVEALLKETTEATRVHIFDHTLRQGHIELDNIPAPNGKPKEFGTLARGQPVGLVHVDYDHLSGIDRLDALLPEEADKLRQTPFAVIQVWRPLKGPVRSSPLGIIDASTVAREDLSTKELRLPSRLGRNFALHYSENHRWYYAKGINTDEAYVFVCYDSRRDGRARFTPHTGFQDLSIGKDAAPRESVELRCYVFWENDAPQEVKRVY